MLGVLFLGFLIGLQHAVEADHLAAVASLATRGKSLRDMVHTGAVWGVGHTLTLFAFGGVVMLAGEMVPGGFVQLLEMAVGVMLVLLGADVLRRLLRERVHFHAHSHGAERHFHAHRHRPRLEHARDPHRHNHAPTVSLRALFVGMMHGMAGSAALIVLALGAVDSVWQGLLYILLFGAGSIVGMAVLGVVISVPLRRSATGLTWINNGLQAVLGIFTVGLGAYIIYDIGVAGGPLV